VLNISNFKNTVYFADVEQLQFILSASFQITSTVNLVGIIQTMMHLYKLCVENSVRLLPIATVGFSGRGAHLIIQCWVINIQF